VERFILQTTLTLKMAVVIWAIFALLFLGLILAMAAYFIQGKKKTQADYFGMFIVGMIWAPIGIIIENSLFIIMGILFMAIGLKNKDRWGKKNVKWKKLNKQEKKARILIFVFLAIIFLTALIFYVLGNNNLLI